ncbi:hypothetical protein EST38_g3876 [Candolleomyces aberdarensis]|uniref:Uncharacterized protein n=1 Tax=Candolleomyces aberdarensis TaxID=2316362 RepID=A0A4Q2DT15_9AGAR|nr:hypothetical protein EST38_g3876 [Candolleomyces aberdarensis]
MSYQIFGRAIKNEYLALGTFATAFGGAFLATRGGEKKAPPADVKQAKAEVPINAGSKYVVGSLSGDEEAFIRQFIAEAEKEGAGASH